MKSFKVTVSNEKIAFVKELLDNLDISYSELVEISEPRIYPATNFEIRSKKNAPVVESPDEVIAKKISVEDRQENIKDVLRRIEELRNRK